MEHEEKTQSRTPQGARGWNFDARLLGVAVIYMKTIGVSVISLVVGVTYFFVGSDEVVIEATNEVKFLVSWKVRIIESLVLSIITIVITLCWLRIWDKFTKRKGDDLVLENVKNQ